MHQVFQTKHWSHWKYWKFFQLIFFLFLHTNTWTMSLSWMYILQWFTHTQTDKYRHTHVRRYNTGYTCKIFFCVTFVNNYSSTECTVLLQLLADPENWQKLTDSRWLTDGPWCLALSVRLEWFRYHRQLVFPLFSPVFFLLVEFGWFKWLEVL